MTYLNTPHSRSIGMGARIYDAWSTYRSERQHNALYRETTRQLGGLSERQLEDIGVSRNDIESLARNHTVSL
jgi:uncharacterized protein YjiS (DUF1127 family)